jgi:predicted nuclease with TOPRIM domain
VVQGLLAERRELMVSNERLRLELEEVRVAAAKPHPRLARMEVENSRLRDELAAARARVERLEEAIRRALAELARKHDI